MAEQSTKKSSSQVPTDPIDQHSALIGCERKMQGCVSWKTIFLSAIPILEKEGGEDDKMDKAYGTQPGGKTGSWREERDENEGKNTELRKEREIK